MDPELVPAKLVGLKVLEDSVKFVIQVIMVKTAIFVLIVVPMELVMKELLEIKVITFSFSLSLSLFLLLLSTFISFLFYLNRRDWSL